MVASVSDDAGVAHLVKQTMDKWGRIDVLVANAGILRDKSFGKMELKDFEAVVERPSDGHRQALQGGVGDHEGARAMAASWSPPRPTGLYGNFGQTNYGAAKLSLVGLMNSLKLEGAPRQYQGERHLPGGGHPHDRSLDAAPPYRKC
jgi:NAD(P)-dependent dehydrogenase (short-subunit alcohol dehydrogenase family)